MSPIAALKVEHGQCQRPKESQESQESQGEARSSLEAPGFFESEGRAHNETQIEPGGVNQKSFSDVLMPAKVDASHAAAVEEMCHHSFEQFASMLEEVFAFAPLDPSPVEVDRSTRIGRTNGFRDRQLYT